MANTTNGIYYPNDYNAAADVLADMKQMAESIDVKFGDVENNEVEIKQDISKIKEEQETQNNKITGIEEKDISQDDLIEELQNQVVELESENENLKNQIPIGETEGENITLNDSADMEFKELRIGGNSWQETRSGRNKFNANLIPASTGIIVTNNGKTITMPIATTGNGFNNTLIKLSEFAPELKVGDVAVVRFERNLGLTYNNVIYLQGSAVRWTINTAQTITQEMLDSTVVFYGNAFNYGETEQVVLTDFSIMLASETDTSWEQFGQMPSPEFRSEIRNVTGSANITVCNKNWFTGWIKGKGLNSTTGVEVANTTSAVSDFIKIDFNKNSNYYLSGLTTNLFSLVAGYNKDKVFLGRTNGGKPTYWELTKDIFVNGTPQGIGDIEYIRVSHYVTVTSTSQTIDEIDNLQTQLEVGAASTEYKPHQAQQITFPLSEGQRMYKDSYLADDGVHHKRGRYVLTGNETFKRSTGSNVVLYDITISDMLSVNVGKGICSHYTNFAKDYISDDTKVRFGWINNKIYFYTSFETVEEWKAYLAEQYTNGTPVTVEYELAEEIIDPYTEEQQLVYNEIKKAHSYKNVTHIFSTDETSPVFEVTYRKDLETMLNNINTAIVSLGGV